jgi:hypothetical protein
MHQILRWLRKNSFTVASYIVFAIAYITMSLTSAPHVIDNFPDSHTYLTLSFLGHAERLWTIPLLYSFGQTEYGRVILQSVIGAACWICLAVQLGYALHSRPVRLVAQGIVLLMSLCAPILQWNRIILSESLSISITVLFLAVSLSFARRLDWKALAAFLLVAALWTFTRQAQALVVGALVLPLLILALLRPKRRTMAGVAAAGVVVIGIWGTVTSLQTSSVSPAGISPTNPSEVQLAGLIQFRAATDSAEMAYFYEHGLPHVSVLKVPPRFTAVGQPVNVAQFADPYAEYLLADNPEFKQWADKHGQGVYLRYLITHPWPTLTQVVIHFPQLTTMNPDYASTRALPGWASAALYGNLSSVATPNRSSGAPRSADPIYMVALLCVGGLLGVLSAIRRRLTCVIVVAVVAVLFAVVWGVAVWSFAATELPREFIETAVLLHLALLVLIVGSVDALLNSTEASSARRTAHSRVLRSEPSVVADRLATR